ncbi:MAG: hypothetical protein FWH27_16270 [Planctomycetaceae bacterium]|nr:hypothetical protein [Planctomycetaceae bacterium]
MSIAIDPNYELPPPDTVEIDCETLAVTGKIQSPTVTQLEQSISNHANNILLHRDCKVLMLTTDGVSETYDVLHDLGTVNLQVTFYDVTSLPQRLFFVHWEPVSENVIRIVPDVILQANRTIKVLIQ